MSSDLIRCCICFADYDLKEHIPVMLSQCGHNTCEPCANSIIKSAHPECPICRKVFPKHPSDTKYVPNRQIKEQLEREGQYQSCKTHEGQLLEFYCKTDKCKVCVDCCFNKGEQSHKGHEIERIADLKEEIDNKRKVFEDHLESCRMTHEEAKVLVTKKKQELINKSKEIERVAKLIAMEASLRVRGVFDEEEEKVEKICGQDSEITKKIQDRVTEYKNIKTADLSVLLEENPEEFTKKLDNSKVQEYLQNLNNQIKLPGAPVIVQDSSKLAIEAPASLTHLKVNGYITFEVNEDELSMTVGEKFNKNVALDLAKCDREVNRIRIILDKFKLYDEDIQVIAYLWARLQPSIHSVDITYRQIKMFGNEGTPFEEHLIDFPKMIFSNPQTLKSIGLTFFESSGSDQYLKFLTEKILPQCPNLTSLSLTFTKANLNNQALPQFITYLNSRPKGIVHFSLTINQRYDNLIPLKLPNLKSFQFSTDQSTIAENGFLHNSLLSIKSLEECDLELPNNVPHHFVQLLSLFYSFSQLKTLKVSMSEIRMAKSELDNLASQLRSHLKDLKTLIVNISETEPLSQPNGPGGIRTAGGRGVGGLFSNASLLPNPPLANTSSAFGQRSSTASSGGLFGSQARSSASASVFGQQSSTASSGGFFANQARPAVTSSVSVQRSSTASSGGLFANQARSSESSFIFGPVGLLSSSNNQAQQQPNILANVPQQSRSLFNNNNNR